MIVLSSTGIRFSKIYLLGASAFLQRKLWDYFTMIRLPLSEVEPQNREKLVKIMKEIGLLNK